MLSLECLNFAIDQRTIFLDLSITFLPSSFVILHSPNGSGKTSLLRMIAGVQAPTSGQILYNFLKCSDIKKPYCTYIGHNIGLKSQLTVFDHLKFWSSSYNSLEALEAAIYYFSLQDILYNKCYTLSAGTQKKVALAKLIACQSNLWLLDEVDLNLDQENKELLNNLIVLKANNGGIILSSSHSDGLIRTAQTINLLDYL